MNVLKRQRKLELLTVVANAIISKKHLHFEKFFASTTQYEYDCYVAHSNYYDKLTPTEYKVLSIVVKKQYDLLGREKEVLPPTQEEKEEFWEEK